MACKKNKKSFTFSPFSLLLLLSSFLGTIALFFSLIVFEAKSYIPKLSSILSKTTRNHGNGWYFILQEVSFKDQYASDLTNKEKNLKTKNSSKQDSFFPFMDFFGRERKTQKDSVLKPYEFHFTTVREKWWIQNGEKMRLEIEGIKNKDNQIRAIFIYNSPNKYWLSSLEEIKKSPKKPKSIEAFFHFREEEKMFNRMKREKMIFTNEIFPKRRSQKNDPSNYQDTLNASASSMRLMRVGGKITYGIGRLSSSQAFYPGLWIEQDRFLIQKIRLMNESEERAPSDTKTTKKESEKMEIFAKDYKTYKNKLWLPQIRKIQWNKKEIFIKLLKVQSIKPSKKNFDSSGLKNKQNLLLKEKWEGTNPSLEWIREFYHQWR